MRLQQSERWQDGAISLFLLGPDDVTDAYVDWLNDPAVNQYLESRFVHHDKVGVENFVASNLDSPNNLMFGITDRQLNRHVGNIKIGPIDRNHGVAEVGLMIGDRAAWGRRIATHAIQRTAAIARHDLGLRRLTAGCYASNIGSRKAFARAGFVEEGVRPKQCLLNDIPEDTILMGLSFEDLDQRD